MRSNLTLHNICKKCGGYKFAPYNSNTSATVRLCHCTKISKMELENVIKAMKVVFFNDPPGDRSSSHKIDDDEV